MGNEPDLAPVFLDSAPEDARERFWDLSALEWELGQIVETARQRWPSVSLSPTVFVGYLGQRCPVENTETALAEINTEELYLACACVQGDAAAIAEFDATYLEGAKPALGSLDVPQSVRTEARQMLRERLLYGLEGQSARIATFAGRGDLQSWVRVGAVRLALELHRRAGRERPLDDATLANLSDAGDPEGEYLQGRYREVFEEAFREALGGLSSRERNLLRYRHLDGLTVEQIGTIYGVNRSSISRRLTKPHDELLRETRRRLITRLQVSRSVAQSIVRMVRSQVDISVRRLLEPSEPGEDQ